MSSGAKSSTAAEPLGEFGRIRRLFAPLAAGCPGALGLGDDAAVLDVAPGERCVLTTDALVEGVHFVGDEPAGLIARKALRVNLSDLAAMGARPAGYLLTTGLPQRLDDDWVAQLAAGLAEDQAEFGIHLMGGDSVSTPGPSWLSIAAIGIASGAVLTRSGARPGDRVWVSGTIGDGALGLDLLKGAEIRLPAAQREGLIERYRLPRPRVALGPRLVGCASAALDVSDGLLADLGHIAEQSGVGAVVDAARLPLSPAAASWLAADPSLMKRLLTGGDDYELLFTAPPSLDAIVNQAAGSAGVPVTAIGRITAGTGVMAHDAAGGVLAVDSAGWRHF